MEELSTGHGSAMRTILAVPGVPWLCPIGSCALLRMRMCVKPRLALGALVMFAKQAFMGEKRKHRFLHLNWDHVNVDSLEAASYMAAPFLFP